METEGSVNIIRNFSTGTRSKINRGKKRHDADSDSRDVEGLGQRPSSRQALRAIYHAASVQELESASNLPGIKDCKVLLMAVLQARVTHHSTIIIMTIVSWTFLHIRLSPTRTTTVCP